MSNVLESAIAAMRSSHGGDADGDLADATRERLVRSLEVRERHHRQLTALATVLVLLVGGTGAWAWSTGAIGRNFGGKPEEVAPTPTPAPPPPARASTAPDARSWPSAPSEIPAPSPAHAPTHAPAPVPAPVIVPEPTPAPVPVPAPAPRLAQAEIEVLYRRAHELHFRNADRAAALAAWDAYLAAEPHGRFSVEARFNRALVLVRLGRYAEALAALEPYARGEVEGGYRRSEAAALVDRLRSLVTGDRAGNGSAMAVNGNNTSGD
jgi:hypothetical protein